MLYTDIKIIPFTIQNILTIHDSFDFIRVPSTATDTALYYRIDPIGLHYICFEKALLCMEMVPT